MEMKRQDKGFKSNDQVPRGADAVHAVLSDKKGDSFSEEVALSRLTRAADVNTSKSKKKIRKSLRSSLKYGFGTPYRLTKELFPVVLIHM